jgi:GR25 family glycosyltransferase involved in LPS biosynthesis
MKGYVINLKESTERLAQFRENEFPFEVERFDALTPTSLGIEDTPEHRDWACSLSHIAVLKSITEFPTIVLEDDCILLKPWSFIEATMSQLPPVWACVYLGANLQKPLTQYSENFYNLHSGHATHATIYNSKELVDYAIEHYNTKDYRCFDVLMAYDVQKKFECFAIYPICATQRSCMSDINGKFLDNYNIIVDSYAKNIVR